MSQNLDKEVAELRLELRELKTRVEKLEERNKTSKISLDGVPERYRTHITDRRKEGKE